MVRDEPLLYEMSNSDYKNNSRKGGIATKCGYRDGKEAMKVWKNLRSSYKKKKDKKLPSGSASEQEKQKWVHYDELNFLHRHMDDRTTHSSTLAPISSEVIIAEEESKADFNREYVSHTSPIPRKKVRALDEFELKMLELVKGEEICALARDVDERMKKLADSQHARKKISFERAVREQIFRVDDYFLKNEEL